MDRHLSMPCCKQFIPMHHYPQQFNEQLFCMETKQNMALHNSYIPSSISHHDKTLIVGSNFSTINRQLSMPSFDEDHPLRIHVGNIPFLWTIDDLCKQFLVFGPIKDPEIVFNERGSKGFGFITFLRQSDGLNAIRVKNGSIADGRKITVALASSRSFNRMNCSCCYIKQ